MDDELIVEFLAETGEALSELDVDIVSLEQNPEDSELIGKIFRLVHTVKGTCGFLGLPRLETVAHHGENVLGRFRDGDLKVTPEYVTLILEAFDRIKEIVGAIEETGSEPEGDDKPLLDKLDVVYNVGKEIPTADIEVDLMSMSLDELRAHTEGGSQKTEETESEKEEVETEPDIEAMLEQAKAEIKAKEPEKPEIEKKETTVPVVTQSLRVNVQVLEDLMTMVSELVLTRNQLLQILRSHSDSEFTDPLQRLSQVVSELQEGVMKTRMQPVGNAWGKLPRIIRDLSVELGKKINLEMQGQETELDRQVLDLIKDPLMHMVRNSGDHGVEMPEERVAAGKSEEGHILLRAFHEGGHIIIEIADDGKGLSTAKIKEKVMANGLATEEELDQMPDHQIHQYIFSAGLSTADKVTAVSGRGVGMDVVRTNIEKIGGVIDLKSVEGKGSTFTIKIPLTLAIVSALIVDVAGDRYAIPQLSVQELVRTSKNSGHKIEMIKGTPVLRLRDRLLPLLTLSEILQVTPEKIKEKHEEIQENDEEKAEIIKEEPKDLQQHYIVVVQVGSYTFGLIVDKVFDTEEIVVKPVPHIFSHIGIYAGNTILGDGSVIMILDPNGIANAASDVSLSDNVEFEDEEKSIISDSERKTSLLVFRAGSGALKTVPLSLVSRLEDINVDTMEETNNQKVVQYRGQLMPIIPFDKNMSFKEKGTQSVLVFSDNDKSMGLMVDEIVDIVEEIIDVQISGTEAGILGSAIIDGQAMDVIDVGHYLSSLQQSPTASDNSLGESTEKQNKVLIVDDSSFFQEMLSPLLNVAGYQVYSVESAEEALKFQEDGHVFNVIVSDIEMPGMNGFEFVKEIKSKKDIWKNTPVIALSAHSAASDVKKGLDAGFDRYVMKFDKEGLLKAIHDVINVSQIEMEDVA